MRLAPKVNSSRIEIETGEPALGGLMLWVPEAICSNQGMCAVYPLGTWVRQEEGFSQRVTVSNSIGPGNCPRIDDATFECCGIRIPADSQVEWETDVTTDENNVRFAVRLSNVGKTLIRKAGAAVCLRFLHPGWWSDSTTFVSSGQRMVSLANLGRNAGRDNGFQAYLLRGESHDHRFYGKFWGFNERRLDIPVMVSENTSAGLCVGIQSDRAYFLHSNLGNPCTDIMLAFGDVRPGKTSEALGVAWVRRGCAADFPKRVAG